MSLVVEQDVVGLDVPVQDALGAEEVERAPLEIAFDSPGTILVRRNGARVTVRVPARPHSP